MDDTRYVYAVMERADDNLGRVLRERPLEPDELRELLNGTLSALDFIHAEGFLHSSLKPTNVLAVGDGLKLSSDNLQALNQPRGYAQAPGIYDAPETGAGVHVVASDLYSLGVLITEAATGSPLETARERVPAPFDAIVRGTSIRDPEQRWTSQQVRAALEGRPVIAAVPLPPRPVVETPRAVEDHEEIPAYKRLRVLGIGGALAAGAVCALLVHNARQPKAPINVTPAPISAAPTPAAPTPAGRTLEEARASAPVAHTRDRFVVVAATYHKMADAEKRARALRKKHNSLHPQVIHASGSNYLVTLGGATSEQQARVIERKAHGNGGIRDAYVTRID